MRERGEGKRVENPDLKEKGERKEKGVWRVLKFRADWGNSVGGDEINGEERERERTGHPSGRLFKENSSHESYEEITSTQPILKPSILHFQ